MAWGKGTGVAGRGEKDTKKWNTFFVSTGGRGGEGHETMEYFFRFDWGGGGGARFFPPFFSFANVKTTFFPLSPPSTGEKKLIHHSPRLAVKTLKGALIYRSTMTALHL